ncbi:MAG TPA: hypothetical protein VFV83_10325 [Chthoniobacteraceae bacterium]|nr:hypothetical protein [Chthoniobacteraceae bacterium]
MNYQRHRFRSLYVVGSVAPVETWRRRGVEEPRGVTSDIRSHGPFYPQMTQMNADEGTTAEWLCAMSMLPHFNAGPEPRGQGNLRMDAVARAATGSESRL